MGRPPNCTWSGAGSSSNSSPSRPWAPPMILATAAAAPGGGSNGPIARGGHPHHHQASNNNSHKAVRQYSLPMPLVSVDVANAIRESLSSSINPLAAAQQNRIRILTTKLQDQQNKVHVSAQNILDLETRKEQSLCDIRERRHSEAAQSMATLERKWRTRHAKEAAAARTTWQEQLDKECDARRKAWSMEREENLAAATTTVTSTPLSPALKDGELEDEPNPKRPKTVEPSEISDASVAVSTSEPTESSSMPEVSGKEQTSSTTTTTTTAPPAVADTYPTPSSILPSDTLKKELADTASALEKQNETRTEMIWLLKQVIKAEEKQKIQFARKSIAATTTSSSDAAAS